MAKLEYKLHITGTITVETGLHIGGSEAELDIGGIDSSVIKIKQGKDRVPYIPGSSLKGKLRNLIARSKGYTTKADDKGPTKSLFEGDSGKKEGRKLLKSSIPARLIVRDAYMDKSQTENLDDYLEDKAENVITRESGIANPRHMERVTNGAKFKIDLIMDIYKRKRDESNPVNQDHNWDKDDPNQFLNTLRLGFQLLQKDYLGGSGTRGYGQVALSDLTVKKMMFTNNGDIEIDKEFSYDFKLDKTTATA